jgi:uncharacterized protein (DUF2126 family)
LKKKSKAPSVLAAGKAADRKLAALGIVVTAGGEPTLIANDHRHPEWNVDALGPTKLAAGRSLAAALRRRLAPDALVTHTMGKLYPGEPLPRWAIGLHWRKRGGPLLAEMPGFSYRFDRENLQGPEAAERLARALPAALGLKTKAACLPAREQIAGTIAAREVATGRRLAPWFKPGEGFVVPAWTDDDRAALLAATPPTGWVLPLDGGKGRWTSPTWALPEPGALFLWPGQSPVGLRLPLHLLAPDAPRRALAVEVRDGELGVFLPPVDTLDDYLDLAGTVQRCVAKLGLGPVALEGYAPPDDGTLVRLNVIADPGVLEINLPPFADTASYARTVDALYAAAAESGLRPWKYQYTGRKVGTGGGAHLLLGGPTAEKSPFFLRPQLLPSLVRFFQHHPSLSYLFTGLFTGPSSQAPRIDESEFEVPYELELALRGVEAMEPPVDRALLDRMLRNLLMDTLGNTHRAEISVDKLWNPFAPNGCLGLVEFRAFEMPPEAPMLHAAVALLRGITAAVVETPFTKPLQRWGAALHDTYALPHFLRRDLEEVLAFVNGGGRKFGFVWEQFAPWFEFRFPVVGTMQAGKREIEFRQAIEPWPVLGEQPNGGGTSRFVDSSTDRLQIAIPGVRDAEKFRLLANGVPVSFFRDPKADRLLGAVRYRMHACVPGLQPHIAPHSPLIFEWVDAKTGQVIAAKSLRNWKPNDQPYENLPQNDREAQARIAERFTDLPERVGKKAKASKRAPSEGLATTDLRLFPGAGNYPTTSLSARKST